MMCMCGFCINKCQFAPYSASRLNVAPVYAKVSAAQPIMVPYRMRSKLTVSCNVPKPTASPIPVIAVLPRNLPRLPACVASRPAFKMPLAIQAGIFFDRSDIATASMTIVLEKIRA